MSKYDIYHRWKLKPTQYTDQINDVIDNLKNENYDIILFNIDYNVDILSQLFTIAFQYRNINYNY